MDVYLAPEEPQGTGLKPGTVGIEDATPAVTGTVRESAVDGSVVESTASMSPGEGPPLKRQKQKRNKPTLSCEECVERKTKVCRRSSFVS